MLAARTIGLTVIPKRLAYYISTALVCALLATLLVIVFRELFSPLFLKAGLRGGSEEAAWKLIPGLAALRMEHYVYIPAAFLISLFLSLRHMLPGVGTASHLARRLVNDAWKVWVVALLLMPPFYLYLLAPLLGDVFAALFPRYPGWSDLGDLWAWYKATYKRTLLATGLPVVASGVASFVWLSYRHRHELVYPRLVPGVDASIRAAVVKHLLDGDYGEALFKAYRLVEEESRRTMERFGLKPGQSFGHNWQCMFANDNGPLTPRDRKWKIKGVKMFGQGAIHLFRNPMAHADTPFTLEEAVVGIYVADLMLRILRSAVRVQSRDD